ncbi:MAG TPA: hypothetical protein ENH69_01320 [Candidatus Aerophobetes bacterium]|uniref:Uncharacterized protein n=1 Tax=Aerophobetes bacterium TaxID=2030807 RepID=A0A7C1R9C2_UNCAE|nr:hypothetical protein [Candidatus Aerophobetes bacterium]
MKKIIVAILGIVSLLLIWGNICLAEEIELGGDISHNLFYLSREGELSQNITQYGLFLKKNIRGGKGKVYLSFKGGHDSIRKDSIEPVKFDEAYVDIYLKNTDLRVGRQVVSWGTADGINPTNYINPRELSLTETEPGGKPLAILKATYYGKKADMTGVIVFDFEPLEIPEELEIAIGQLIPGFGGFPSPAEIENTLENMEFALKVEKRIADWDTKLSYFHGWEDYPALWIELQPGLILQFEGKAQYQQIDKVGLATAGSLKKVGLWSEIAYVMPREIEEMRNAFISFSMNKPYLQAVLGADYTLGKIYVEGQYIYYQNGSLLSPYNQYETGEDITAGNYLMVQSSYGINQVHSLRLAGIVNLQDSSYTLMPQYTYAINEVTDLSLGAALFLGEAGTEFGMLKIIDFINLGIKISF